MGGEQFGGIEDGKCLSGTYSLTGEVDIQPFNASTDMSRLGLKALFVWDDLAIQADCLDRIFFAYPRSLHICQGRRLFRQPDGVGIGAFAAIAIATFTDRDQIHRTDRAFAGFVLAYLGVHGAGPDTRFILYEVMAVSFVHLMPLIGLRGGVFGRAEQKPAGQ